MPPWLKTFLQVGLEIAKVSVPAISAVEIAVKKAKSGGDKKEAVIDIIKASPNIAEALSQQEILDEDLFARGIGKVNDGYTDIMNSLKKSTDK